MSDVKDLPPRLEMCPSCPFRPDRKGAPIPPEIMRVVHERIDGWERWVCHSTCGSGGRTLPNSRLCAGAPRKEKP